MTGIFGLTKSFSVGANLVGNGGDMSACVATRPIMLAENQLMSNVTDAMTQFVAGSCVRWHAST